MFCLKALALNLPPTTRTSFAVSAIAKLSPKRGESPTITFMGTLGIIRCSFMASSAGAVTDWVVSLPCVMYSIARQQKSFTNETSTSRAGKALLTPLPSVGNSVKIAVPPLLLHVTDMAARIAVPSTSAPAWLERRVYREISRAFNL
jgi:hypothetical protein